MESITFVLFFLSKQIYEDQLKLKRESEAEESEKYIFDCELSEERKVKGQKLEIWPRMERKIKKNR